MTTETPRSGDAKPGFGVDTPPMTTSRDTEILRDLLSEQIEQLRPMTQMGLDWRPTFKSLVAEWQRKANGCPATSETHREYLSWSLAHQFLLDES